MQGNSVRVLLQRVQGSDSGYRRPLFLLTPSLTPTLPGITKHGCSRVSLEAPGQPPRGPVPLGRFELLQSDSEVWASLTLRILGDGSYPFPIDIPFTGHFLT